MGFPVVLRALALDVHSRPAGAVEEDGVGEGEGPDGKGVYDGQRRGESPPRLPWQAASRKSVSCRHVGAQPERYTGAAGRFHRRARLA